MGRVFNAWRCGMVVLLAALAGCSGGGDSDPPPSEASATIGAAGGTLNGPDGVQLVVPPGALAQDTTLRIARVEGGAPGLPPAFAPSTPTYEFTPHGQLFRLPVTIRMPYERPADADRAGVFMASPGEDWQAVSATVSGGVAEWQRLSLSFGGGLACVLRAGDDPRQCLMSAVGAQATATPASAMTTTPYTNGASHLITAEATVRLTIRYAAPNNCTAARLRILRASYVAPTQVVFEQPVPTSPSQANPLTVRGSTVFDVALTHADNGPLGFYILFQCTRPNGSTSGHSASQLFSVAVPDPGAPTIPAVTSQPADQAVVEPASATFTATASGTPTPALQWQTSTDGGSTWTDIAGATAASYTTPPTSPAEDGHRFRAVFSNSAGAATSGSATLTVTAAPDTTPPPLLGTWSGATPVEQVTNDTGGLVREARLACGRGGHCVATWARISTNDLLDAGIYAARYTTGIGWTSPLQLSGDQGREPQVAVDGSGNAVVVWSARDGGGSFQAFVRRYAIGSGWLDAEQLSPAGTEPAFPPLAVAMTGTGSIVAGYTRRLLADNNVDSLWASHRTASGWSAVRVASAVSVDDESGLRLILDPLARATMAWSNGNDHVVSAASGSAGGNWTAAVALSGARQARDLGLALDVDGAAYVAWSDDASGTPRLNLRGRPTGAAWGATQRMNVPEGIDDLDLAAGPSGRATAAYVRGNGAIVTRDFDAGAGWSAGDQVLAASSADFRNDHPRIVMDTGGNTTVVWRYDEFGPGSIRARSFAIGLGWAPALDAPAVTLATYDQAFRELALAGTGTGRAAALIVRTDSSFLDELLGPVQFAP